jgi:molybdenum-dependent DNA-binding transcriptional regulator ModE
MDGEDRAVTAWRGVGTFLMPAAKASIRKSSSKGATGFRRLPLAWLRVFVAAAEHLSFTQAADALGVSTAAVSMQIRALEEYLRSRLFRRRGRLVQLTAEGTQLLPRVRRGLEELERAINEARLERCCVFKVLVDMASEGSASA